jgi:hypothetical protein
MHWIRDRIPGNSFIQLSNVHWLVWSRASCQRVTCSKMSLGNYFKTFSGWCGSRAKLKITQENIWGISKVCARCSCQGFIGWSSSRVKLMITQENTEEFQGLFFIHPWWSRILLLNITQEHILGISRIFAPSMVFCFFQFRWSVHVPGVDVPWLGGQDHMPNSRSLWKAFEKFWWFSFVHGVVLGISLVNLEHVPRISNFFSLIIF